MFATNKNPAIVPTCAQHALPTPATSLPHAAFRLRERRTTVPLDMDAVAAALASNPHSNLSPQLKDKHVQRLRALRQRLQALKQLRTWPVKTTGDEVGDVEESADEGISAADRTGTSVRREDNATRRVPNNFDSPESASLAQESLVNIPGSFDGSGGEVSSSGTLGLVTPPTPSEEEAERGGHGATRSIRPERGGQGGTGTDGGSIYRERHGVATGLSGGEVGRDVRDAGGNKNDQYTVEFNPAVGKPQQQIRRVATPPGRFDRGGQSAGAESNSPLLMAGQSRTEKGGGAKSRHVDSSGDLLETQGAGKTRGASTNGAINNADLRTVGGNRIGGYAGDTGGGAMESESTSGRPLVSAGNVSTSDLRASENDQELGRSRDSDIESHRQRERGDPSAAGNGIIEGVGANDHHGGVHDLGGRENLHGEASSGNQVTAGQGISEGGAAGLGGHVDDVGGGRQGGGGHGSKHVSNRIDNNDNDGVVLSDYQNLRVRPGVSADVETLNGNASNINGNTAATVRDGGSNHNGVGGGGVAGGGDRDFGINDHAAAAANSGDEREAEHDGRPGRFGGTVTDGIRGESGSGGQAAAGPTLDGNRGGNHQLDEGGDRGAIHGGSKSGDQTIVEESGEKRATACNHVGRQAGVTGDVFSEVRSGDLSATDGDGGQSTTDGHYSPGGGGIVRDIDRGYDRRGGDENVDHGDKNQVEAANSHKDGHGGARKVGDGEGTRGNWGAAGQPSPFDERLEDGYDHGVGGTAVDGKVRVKSAAASGDQAAGGGGPNTGVTVDKLRGDRADIVGVSVRDESTTGNQEVAEHGASHQGATGIRQYHRDAGVAGDGELYGDDTDGGSQEAAVNGITKKPTTAGYQPKNDASGVNSGDYPTKRAMHGGAEGVAGGRIKGDSRALSAEHGVDERATGNALDSDVGDASITFGPVVSGAGNNKTDVVDRVGEENSQTDRRNKLLAVGPVLPKVQSANTEDDRCSVVSSVSDDAVKEGMTVTGSEDDEAGEGGAGTVRGRPRRQGTGGVSGEAGGVGGMSTTSANASRSRYQVPA